MSYTLQGRQIALFQPADRGDAVPAAPCIFCGVACKHIDDGGTAWLLGAMMERGPEHFLYHVNPPCPDHILDLAQLPPHGSVWRCGCAADYVENVGSHCHGCGKLRANCAPYPSVLTCPRCAETDLPAREPGGVIKVECPHCQFVGRYDHVTETIVPA